MHRRLLPVAFLAAAAVLAGSAAGDSVTVGQTPTPNAPFTINQLVLQTGVASGTSYTVPPGDWQVTSWSLNVGDIVTAGPVAAVLAQPTGGGNYTIDAVSPVETPAANTLNVFPASFVAHGGDVLGIWIGSLVATDAVLTGTPADTIAFQLGVGSVPSVGASFATTAQDIERIPVSVTLEPLTTPAQKISDLQATVSGLGLPKGLTTALNSTLQDALDALAVDDTAGACDALRAFLNQVKAQTGKKLTSAQAQQLTDAANDIRTQLGC
jgi:hypothetical protein